MVCFLVRVSIVRHDLVDKFGYIERTRGTIEGRASGCRRNCWKYEREVVVESECNLTWILTSMTCSRLRIALMRKLDAVSCRLDLSLLVAKIAQN